MPKGYRTGDQALVREYNRAIVLNLLRLGAPHSRADLAVATGLNKTTVSSLIGQLLADGLVREIGPTVPASAGGRPGTLLELNPAAGCLIGAEVGVRYLRVVLSDFTARSLWQGETQFRPEDDQADVLGRLVALVRDAISTAETAGQNVLGLGVGVHGPVDVNSGTWLFAPNLGWRDVPLREMLSQEFPFPVFVDNDAKVSAMSEQYFGVAQHTDNFVYVIANVGLGVGVVLGGQVHRGAGGLAGEVGHTTIMPDGPLCKCGNRGCWEVLASQSALVNRLQQAVSRGGQTRLCTDNGSLAEVSISQIVEAACAGDRLVLDALEETGVYLGIGIANLINSFNPSLVVLGGSLSLAADYLLPVIERTVAERAMPWPRAAARILVSAHRLDTCLMGGLALVMHDLLSHPWLEAPKGKRSLRSEHKHAGREVRAGAN